jgi:hypothetical protein
MKTDHENDVGEHSQAVFAGSRTSSLPATSMDRDAGARSQRRIRGMGSSISRKRESLTMESFHVQLVSKDGSDLGTLYDQACQSLEAIGADTLGETTADAVSKEPARLQLELDGSFVCVGDGWQLDGMMYDIAERLQYVDLKGCCPKMVWSSLVRCLAASPSAAAVVKLPQGGLYDLQTFEETIWP